MRPIARWPERLRQSRLTAAAARCCSERVSSIGGNRAHWNRISSSYQSAHDPQIGAAPRLWGMFSIPDAQLRALGDVSGQRVLELGCGAAQWSASLAADGATVVAFDLSDAQLAAAAARVGAADIPLVQGAAEQLPFRTGCFDVVFCDHGGLSWAHPGLAVPEAARVLRAGGRLVFNVASPWYEICYDEQADAVTAQLRRDYFGLGVVDEGDGAVSYQLGYGEWIRTLRGAGLIVEDLIEPRPAPGQRSGYMSWEPSSWARRWPAEMLWIARKA
jgi:ubiquinone/menaquinone biosynthesis C-methylase UbiE